MIWGRVGSSRKLIIPRHYRNISLWWCGFTAATISMGASRHVDFSRYVESMPFDWFLYVSHHYAGKRAASLRAPEITRCGFQRLYIFNQETHPRAATHDAFLHLLHSCFRTRPTRALKFKLRMCGLVRFVFKASCYQPFVNHFMQHTLNLSHPPKHRRL